jgi:NAD(P)-dependent dehydrogenase (short-subunit alcohol dehydrogenase family)
MITPQLPPLPVTAVKNPFLKTGLAGIGETTGQTLLRDVTKANCTKGTAKVLQELVPKLGPTNPCTVMGKIGQSELKFSSGMGSVVIKGETAAYAASKAAMGKLQGEMALLVIGFAVAMGVGMAFAPHHNH